MLDERCRRIPDDYVERVYAGVLGKTIGVRYGAPIEMWSSGKINRVFGELNGYVECCKNFAADDDTNGTFFFVRALEDYGKGTLPTPEQIGLTWLNYAPYEHGFYWWGGYGTSSEHTAYLNMRHGIMPPFSGSKQQNGKTISEQVGGQIFIEAWGLAAPANPGLAAKLAKNAACVGHDGEAVYGGMFIAAAVSVAFEETDPIKIIRRAIGYIPADSGYANMVERILEIHNQNPEDWRVGFALLKEEFWIDKYGGNCHVIPNAAIVVLSLAYGEGDFSRSLDICNMCGFDTDCNSANVGTILAVSGGLACIDYEKWRAPVNDFQACSSVIGYLNAMDLASYSLWLSRLGYELAGQAVPARWESYLKNPLKELAFELPGSTHGMKASIEFGNVRLRHTTETARSGNGSLKASVKNLGTGNRLKVWLQTHFDPQDFMDARYMPAFSPTLYPGQNISLSIMSEAGNTFPLTAYLYVLDENNGKTHNSHPVDLIHGQWSDLSFDIPYIDGGCIREAGVCVTPRGAIADDAVAIFIDDFVISKAANYSIDFTREKNVKWGKNHMEISQFTILKGNWRVEDGALSGGATDFGEVYTGDISWGDYSFTGTMTPQTGECHSLLFRVQGAMRSYALTLSPGKIGLYKNANGYGLLCETPFVWSKDKSYTFTITARGGDLCVRSDGKVLLEISDPEPYLNGCIGAGVRDGSRCLFTQFVLL